MNQEANSNRKSVYALLITVAAAAVAGRILAAELVYEPSVPRPWPPNRPTAMPTFGSNDRSRWATVRALVDGDPATGQPKGSFVIGRRDRQVVLSSAVAPLAATDPVQTAVLLSAGYQARTKSDRGIIFKDGWGSVDKVMNPETLEFYSSKPPLLSVLVAGLYWLVQQLTGWTLADNPFAVVRAILLLINLLPFIGYLVLLARLIGRFGQTDWGRYFTLTCACFATLPTTFAVTFNNHSLATYSLVFALYPLLNLVGRASPRARFTPVVGADEEGKRGCARRAHAATLARYVMAGFFASFTACCDLPAASFAAAFFLVLLWRSPFKTLAFFVPAGAIPVAAFLLTNYMALGEWKPAYEKFGTEWYEYEGSHWQKPPPGQVKPGIDWAGGKESRWSYALHLLVGHHGLFSLTPVWLLALMGMFRFSYSNLRNCLAHPGTLGSGHVQHLLAFLTLILTVVVIGFYLVKSDNYGGWTSGLRWLMWLTPLWLLCLLPVADRLADYRWGRAAAYVLLGFSVLSISYPAWNPWRHPWIYRFMEALGWKGY